MRLKTAAAKARQKRIASLIKEGRLGALCAFAAGAAMVGGCSKEEPEEITMGVLPREVIEVDAPKEEPEEITMGVVPREAIEVDAPKAVTNKGMEMKPMRSMGRAPLGRTNRVNEAQRK